MTRVASRVVSRVASRVAARFAGFSFGRFELDGVKYQDLNEAAQEAEFAHAADGQPRQVFAVEDDPAGAFKAGETVYTSKGAPD